MRKRAESFGVRWHANEAPINRRQLQLPLRAVRLSKLRPTGFNSSHAVFFFKTFASWRLGARSPSDRHPGEASLPASLPATSGCGPFSLLVDRLLEIGSAIDSEFFEPLLLVGIQVSFEIRDSGIEHLATLLHRLSADGLHLTDSGLDPRTDLFGLVGRELCDPVQFFDKMIRPGMDVACRVGRRPFVLEPTRSQPEPSDRTNQEQNCEDGDQFPVGSHRA
jgi:hypothetical protein